jgi:hypothetical protein
MSEPNHHIPWHLGQNDTVIFDSKSNTVVAFRSSDPTNVAIAKHIVHAVNTHDDLLKALQRAEAAIEDMRTHWSPHATPSNARIMKDAAQDDHAAISEAIRKATS